MKKDLEYSKDLPTEEVIEEGRRGSLLLGLIVGAAVVGCGLLAYVLFGGSLGF